MISLKNVTEGKTIKSHPYYVYIPGAAKTNQIAGRFKTVDDAKAYIAKTQKHIDARLQIYKGDPATAKPSDRIEEDAPANNVSSGHVDVSPSTRKKTFKDFVARIKY